MSKDGTAGKRPYYPKAKTGCLTCKIRRIKCDEARPYCQKCLKTGRKCDGYASTKSRSPETASPIAIRPANIPYINTEAVRYMESYFHRTASDLSGSFDSSFWTRTVLQLSQTEPAIRHAMLAISYFHEQEALRMDSRKEILAPPTGSHSFGFEQYNKAISSLSDRITSGPQARIPALMTCILFVCLEMLRGNASTAMKHHQSGLKILAEMNIRSGLPSKMIESPAAYSSDSNNDTDAKFTIETLVPLFARMTTLSAFVGQGFLPLYSISPDQEVLIPECFDSIPQARSILVDITNLSLVFISTMMHKHMTSQTILLNDFIEQARIQVWFKDWDTALENYKIRKSSHRDGASSIAINALRMQNHLIYVWLSTSTAGSEAAYAEHTPTFNKIINLAEEILLANRKPRNGGKPSFLFDSELIGPLFWTSMKCRDLATRRQAIDILSSLNRREGLWHSRQCAAVAQQLLVLEEPNLELNQTALAPQLRIHIAAVDSEPGEHEYDAGIVPNIKNTHVDEFLQKEYAKSKSPKFGARAYGTWISWHMKD